MYQINHEARGYRIVGKKEKKGLTFQSGRQGPRAARNCSSTVARELSPGDHLAIEGATSHQKAAKIRTSVPCCYCGRKEKLILFVHNSTSKTCHQGITQDEDPFTIFTNEYRFDYFFHPLSCTISRPLFVGRFSLLFPIRFWGQNSKVLHTTGVAVAPVAAGLGLMYDHT